MKAAVVIDSWKLPVFKRHLDAAGYSYKECPGFMPNTLTLQVDYEWVSTLQPIIIAANTECAEQRAAGSK